MLDAGLFGRKCRLSGIASWVARTIAGCLLRPLTPRNSRRRPKGNERERSVSVVKLGTLVRRLQRLYLTDSQQRDAVTYEPGQIVEFHRMARGAAQGIAERRFKSGEQWEVLRQEEGAVIVGRDGVEKKLPLGQTRKFSVFKRENIRLSIGDGVRFTKNVKHHRQEFLNNELRTVVSIDDGKIKFDKREIVRNGATLNLDQRLAVTSHATVRRRLSTNSLPACRFGHSARRTRHNLCL